MFKLRVIVSNVENGAPVAGAPVALMARIPGAKGKDISSIALVRARSDRVGYVSVDLKNLSSRDIRLMRESLQLGLTDSNGDLILEIEGDQDSRRSLLAEVGLLDAEKELLAEMEGPTDADGLVQALLVSLFGAGKPLHLKTKRQSATAPDTIGSVIGPDCNDYAISPESFVDRRATILGADGCEHILPTTLPERSYTIYRLNIRTDLKPPTEREVIEVNKMYSKELEDGSLAPVSATSRLADISSKIVPDTRLKIAELYEFEQSWNSMGHSLGEVKYSLALAPGEATRIAVIDWSREDKIRRGDSIRESQRLKHSQTYDRDIDELVTGNVNEQQGGFSALTGSAGAIDFVLPQYGISAAGRSAIGIGASYSAGNRDMRADSQQDIHGGVLQRTNVARGWNSTVVIQATQNETNELATRIVANMNRGHALTILYYEILRHLCVRTAFRRRDWAVLVPFNPFEFDATVTRRFRAQLEPSLIDRRYVEGFNALDRLAVGDSAYSTARENGDTSDRENPSNKERSTKLYASAFRLVIRSGPGQNGDTFGSVRIALHLTDPVETVELFAKSYGSNNAFKSTQFQSATAGGYTTTTYTRSVPEFNLKRIARASVWWQVSPNLIEADYDGWDLEGIKIDCELRDDGVPKRNHQLLDWSRIPKVGQITFPRPVDVTPDIGAPNNTLVKEINDRLVNKETIATSVTSITKDEAMRVKNAYRAQGLELSTNAISQPVASEDPPRDRDESDPTPESDTTPDDAAKQPTRDSDLAAASMLVAHLNANMMTYNAYIWAAMDARERRLRIAAAAGEIADALGDEVLAVVGNHLAFHYAGPTDGLPSSSEADPPPPLHTIVTLPTRGVFAEAHLGNCNGAEKRDVTRLWNFSELPVSLLPNLEGLTPGPRGQQPNVGQPQLPESIINIVAGPNLPDPNGVNAATDILGRSNIFRDMSALREVSAMLGKLIEAAKPPTIGASAGSGLPSGTAGEAARAKTIVDSMIEQGSSGASGGGGSGLGRDVPVTSFDRLQVAKDYADQIKERGGSDEEALSRFREMMNYAVASADGGIGLSVPDGGGSSLQPKITSSSSVACIRENVTFTATEVPASAQVNWSCTGNPSTGIGSTFTTRFSSEGPKVITATYSTDAGVASLTANISVKELSGAQWALRWPQSTSTSDLHDPFRSNVENFIDALVMAGANVTINTTYRPRERAYLMHYSSRVANASISPQNVPPEAGVDICWLHRDINGNPDLAASRSAAQQLANAYSVAFPAAFPTRHSLRLAIDMTITWNGNLNVKDASGNTITIASTPRTGADNSDVHALGATYGVIKLVGDRPHWSDTGT